MTETPPPNDAAAADETTTVSFGADVPSQNSPAVIPDQSLASSEGYVDSEDAAGEIGSDDIQWPRLNVVQKVGELSEKFEGFFGSIVMNQETVLTKLGGQLIVQALRAEKFYQFCPPTFDGGAVDLPRFKTASEVVRNGGSLDYEDKKNGNYYEPVANIIFLVREPEPCPPELEGVFLYDVGGKNHLMCGFTAKGSAGYTACAKKLWTVLQAKGSVRKSLWRMTTQKKTFNNNTYAQVVLLPGGLPTPEHDAFYEKFKKVLSR